MEVMKAVLFGIVEGITEWLPISSTGHMILLDEFVKLDVSSSFYSVFQVVIQLGAILAVVVLFWSDFFPFGKSQTSAPLGHRGIAAWIRKEQWNLWGKILAACVPAAVAGVLFGETLEAMFYNYRTVALALIVFGAAFLIVEDRQKGKTPKISSLEALDYPTAVLIGVFQLIAAVFPGTSRSGATIVGALLLGVSRGVAARFTFFLAIPVMFGASLLKLVQSGLCFSRSELSILVVGMAVAFVVSMFVIRFLMEYIRSHNFKVFGWYRIALGVLVLLYFTVLR